MDEHEKIAALYAALAAAQAEFLPIAKNRKVVIKGDRSSYEFRYADLEAINAATRPALSKHGIAVYQSIEGDYLVCVLAHSSGARVSSAVSIPDASAQRDPKQFGGLLTYLRRYLVTGILGVAADDDLDVDGQPAGESQQQPDGLAEFEAQHLQPLKEAAAKGTAALQAAFSAIPQSDAKARGWAKHQAELKKTAAAAAKPAEQVQ